MAITVHIILIETAVNISNKKRGVESSGKSIKPPASRMDDRC